MLIDHVIGGKYRITELIGQGGMGTVFAAVHEGTGARVAIKLIVSNDIKEEVFVRFQREARAAGAIDSHHIVRIFDMGTDEKSGSPFMVMERLNGQDLAVMVRGQKSLPVQDVVDMAAHDLAEKTLVRAKKQSKDLAAQPLPTAKVAPLREADAKKAVEKALKAGRALTAFEPFGRDVQREYFSVTSRGGFELVVSTESQACFGNAFLELLTSPKNEAERLATVACLRALCDKMLAEGVVSCFALAPSDDLGMAVAFVFNGFRRTGLLQNHMVVGGERKDAIIWTRKVTNPADE